MCKCVDWLLCCHKTNGTRKSRFCVTRDSRWEKTRDFHVARSLAWKHVARGASRPLRTHTFLFTYKTNMSIAHDSCMWLNVGWSVTLAFLDGMTIMTFWRQKSVIGDQKDNEQSLHSSSYTQNAFKASTSYYEGVIVGQEARLLHVAQVFPSIFSLSPKNLNSLVFLVCLEVS